jgi:hypothetical protein
MRVKFIVLVIASALVALASPLFAHHSFAAQYDANKPITLKGVVTRFEWTNPHARFFIDVIDDRGSLTNWNLELGSPNILARAGWTRKALSVGDQVTVEGALAKDGSRMANARTVTLASGKTVFAGSSGGDTAATPSPAK